jgi:hypothetical protein
MGLDIALGLMMLVGGIRGWFRGFLLQAIRLGGLIGSVYLAGPIRDLARPYLAPYLKTIDPSLLGRMLWWSSAVIAYLVIVGFASQAFRAYRRRPYGEPEPNRADQFGGFLLATGKTAVMMSFLIGAADRFVLGYIRQVPWAAEQAKTSQALVWHEQYRPADRIWAAPPVQMLVAHVRKMGVDAPRPETEWKEPAIDPSPIQSAAARPPRLDLPPGRDLDAAAPDFARRFDEAMNRIDRPSDRP